MRRDSVDVSRVLASIVALVAVIAVLPLGLIAVSRARFGRPIRSPVSTWDGSATTLVEPDASRSPTTPSSTA